MSGIGVAADPKQPPGALQYRALIASGYSAQEANGWRAQQTAKLRAGGFDQNRIDAYWGDAAPSTSALDAMNRANPNIHTATGPLEMLEAGFQRSVTGLMERGKAPDVVAPENAPLLGKVLNAAGQAVGDIPATITGLIGGAGAGSAAGAAVPVGGETGATEAAGAIAGAGFGANAFPEALRQTMLDAYARGEIHSWGDFWAMAAKSTWETASAGVVGAIAAPVGEAVGGKVLTTIAKPWLARGANMASQAVTATVIGAGLEGRVPNAGDFAIGAATMLGFHGAGEAVGAFRHGRFMPSNATRRVQHNLQDIYRRTGIAPWEAVKKAQTDPAFRQELMAQDVHGNPVTPNFNYSAQDEPPLPKPRPQPPGALLAKPQPRPEPEEGEREEDEKKAAPPSDPVTALLPKVRALEGSADNAISPAGAIGRYQIMPGTARQYGFDPAKLTDPVYNEHAARAILADLSRRHPGDEAAILTAYNAGPGVAAKLITAGPGTALAATHGPHGWEYEWVAARRSEAGLPMETQEYLARSRAMGGGGSGGEPPDGKPPEESAPGEEPKRIAGPENADPFALNTESRVSRFLDSVGEPSSKHRPMLLGFEMELDAARRIDNELKARGLLDPSQDIGIEDMARSTYGSENRANHYFFRGPFDPLTFAEKEGPSLKDVADEVKRIGGNKDKFNAYLSSLRTIEKHGQGIETNIFKGGLKEAEANAADPNLKKLAKANALFQQWTNSGLAYVRDSGGISQKQYDDIVARNLAYISLRRIQGDDIPFQRAGARGFRAINPIARMEGGSDKKIADPWLASIDNMRRMIAFADRNRAAGAIAALAIREVTPGVRELPAPEAKSTLALPGSDKFEPYGLTGSEKEALKPFAQEAAPGLAKNKNRFVWYDNGKPRVFETDDPNVARLYRMADSQPEATLIAKIGQIPASIARSGIALDPSFGLRIALKHQMTAFIADPMHPPPFITMLRAILEPFGKGERFWKAARTGALSGSITDMDRNTFATGAQKLLANTGAAERLWNVVKSPLELAQILTDRLSQANRIGYATMAENRGVAPLKASMNARKAYLDYNEQFLSAAMQFWAKYVPFFKADVLGLRQGWQAVKPGRLGETAVFAALGLVLPQTALYIANREADKSLPKGKHYIDLHQWERDMYFVTPPIFGQRFRLGKPYNFGPLIGIPYERFLELEFENDPHAFDGMLRGMAEPLPAGMPTFALPVIEGMANYSFFTGKPLIPESLKDASPDMQYTAATSAPGKALARLIGPHGANLANVSPIVLDNYVKEWTGTLGADALRAVSAPFQSTGRPWELADLPFAQSFMVLNPGANAKEIEDFYSDMDRLEAAHKDVFLALKRGDMTVYRQDAARAQLYSRLTRMREALSVQHATLQGIDANPKLTADEKRQSTDRIVADMIGIAEAGEKIVRTVK